MDIRHPLKERDWDMIHLCRNFNVPFIPALTKSDKLSNNNIAKAKAFIKAKIPEAIPVALSSKDNNGFDAEEIIKILSKNEIGCRPFFYPMHLQPVFNKIGLFNNEKYPVAENIAKKGFYLPSGLALTETQIHRVCDILRKILKK